MSIWGLEKFGKEMGRTPIKTAELLRAAVLRPSRVGKIAHQSYATRLFDLHEWLDRPRKVPMSATKLLQH